MSKKTSSKNTKSMQSSKKCVKCQKDECARLEPKKSRRDQYRLEIRIGFIKEWVHAGCEKCYFCDEFMSDKRSKVRFWRNVFWHEKCQCKCEGVYFDLDKNGKPKHICVKSKPCIVCGSKTVEFTMFGKYPVPVHPVCKPNFEYECSTFCKGTDRSTYNIRLFFPGWTVTNHSLHIVEVKEAIKTIFLMRNRKGSIWSFVPKDLLYVMARYIATKNGWWEVGRKGVKPLTGRTLAEIMQGSVRWEPTLNKTINGLLVTDICTPERCPMHVWCKYCKDEISPFDASEQCTINRCNTYQYVCDLCYSHVLHGSDPEQACTGYRCIENTCQQCNGKIRPYPTMVSPLCSFNMCEKYFSEPCNCGQSILKDEDFVRTMPEDKVIHVCTRYRCRDAECKECGLALAPFEDEYSKGRCSKKKCFTKEATIWNRFQNIKWWLLGLETDTLFCSRSSKWYSQQIIHFRYELSKREKYLANDEFLKLETAIQSFETLCDDFFSVYH